MTTDGKFEEVTAEIVLPSDKDCITVWLRLNGGNEDTQVAMDYISLEDLGE